MRERRITQVDPVAHLPMIEMRAADIASRCADHEHCEKCGTCCDDAECDACFQVELDRLDAAEYELALANGYRRSDAYAADAACDRARGK